MFNKFKILKKFDSEINALKVVEYDEENRAILKVKLDESNNFVSKYSFDDNPVLKKELAELVESEYLPVPYGKDIIIHLYGLNCIDISRFEQAKYNYYQFKIINLHDDLKNNFRSSMLCFLFGAFILAVYFALLAYNKQVLISEIINIIAWVFIWTGTSLFFLDRRKLQLEQIKNYRLRNVKIKIIEKDKN